MKHRASRRKVFVTLTGAAASTVVASSGVVAHIITAFWSAGGHTLSTTQNANSNMVGFWETLGVGKIACINGRFDPATVELTKRMQSEIANPPQPQTGVANGTTWNAVEASTFPGETLLRLTRVSGTPDGNGFFGYYNGSGSADLYWQGTNTGTGLWKFLPPGAPIYFEATTARTMGSYPQSC